MYYIFEGSQKARNVRMCELWSVCDVHVNWGYSVQESFKEHTAIEYRGR